MNFKTILSVTALAVAGLWGSQASAATICGNCAYNSNTYLGVHNPVTSDSSFFRNDALPVGAFTNTWLFDIAPSGRAAINGNFIPGFPDADSISGFTITLYNVTASTCGAAGAACTGVSLGSLIRTGVPGNSSSNIGFGSLTQGRYAFVVTGTVVSIPTLYSGQLTTRVPEPGTLALLGLGLVGLGAARRRKA